MTLFGTILHQVSQYSLRSTSSKRHSGLRSPPPEEKVVGAIVKRRKERRKLDKWSTVKPKVDTSPPLYYTRELRGKLSSWAHKRRNLDSENLDMVLAIKKSHFTRGRVDNRWKIPLKPCLFKYFNRVQAVKKLSKENKIIYKQLTSQGPKVDTTESLMQDWAKNRHDIIIKATKKFVLFPTIHLEDIEDPAFEKPKGVKRPRVYFTLRFENGSDIGELQAELFEDICPHTCKLFTELLAGDGVGFSYVGTHIYRKVPRLYWSGGDVAHDNGFGCYAQRGRRFPIGAENYHFSHSMPGLLSMEVTCDDEMCGKFNITFKPLPQLDLRNVVFGRIVRPSAMFNAMADIGKLLSTQPSVLLSASRQKIDNQWVYGTRNTRMVTKSTKKKIITF